MAKQIALAVSMLLSALMFSACAIGTQLRTVPAQQADRGGTYTLYLYGCRYPADVKNAAFLIDEGAQYPFEIFDLDTSYKIIRHVQAEQALRDARKFLLCTTHRVTGTSLSRISDAQGGTVGYEIKPLYFVVEFGMPDILLISYSQTAGMVRAYIRYQPGVERIIESPGGDDSRDSSQN
jgi:hypothetical protein